VLLGRRPVEADDADLRAFHLALIEAAHDVRQGTWALCEATGWPDDQSAEQLLAWCWTDDRRRTLVVVNGADHPAAAMVHPPWTDLSARIWELHDLLSGDIFERDGTEVATSGLYVGLPPWGCHVLRWAPST
jgi:hypothetical protein